MARLRDLAGGRVAVTPSGSILDPPALTGPGPAVLLVTEVTEAVKRLDGARIVDSVDRSRLWEVEAIVLEEVVLDDLGSDDMGWAELVEAVTAAGYDWQVVAASTGRSAEKPG